MTNYKEVIEGYREVDLYKMSDAEYAELKEAEMADMQSFVDAITNSTEPAVMYRIGRAVPARPAAGRRLWECPPQ